jgi:pSer/pThr/pTyr-binding forkhead associated (FHA) protein
MKKDESNIGELVAALHSAEQRLAEREALVTAAIGQTEAARSQYEQANERVESLRRRLDTKEEQFIALQSQLATTTAELTAAREGTTNRDRQIESLQQALKQRDERLAALEQLCEENDNALHALNQDVKRQNLASSSARFAALGLVLESLDEPGIRHNLGRNITTIGRAVGNDIVINSTSASRYHARIVVESDGPHLVDLQSTNGCSVNGRRVFRQAITDRDIVTIGDAKFRLVVSKSQVEAEDRSMDATHALVGEAAVLSGAPRPRRSASHVAFDHDKTKTK